MIIPATFLIFFHYVHTSQNMSPSPICCSFCLVFASLLAHTTIRTHPNQSVPICTHSRHFLTTRQKHDVRGNFPGHRTQILTCETLNAPSLPCFCASRVSWVPTHASTPICTHLHPFKHVCTLTLYVYMCNLIKKYYENNIIFQIFKLITSS